MERRSGGGGGGVRRLMQMNRRLAEMWGSEVARCMWRGVTCSHTGKRAKPFRNGQPDGLTSTFERPCQHTASELNPLVRPSPPPNPHPSTHPPPPPSSPSSFSLFTSYQATCLVRSGASGTGHTTDCRTVADHEGSGCIVDCTVMIQTQKGK